MFSTYSDYSTAVHLVNTRYQWVLLARHQQNSQRYAVDLRIALKQCIRVLIANVRRDDVPIFGSGWE